MKHCQYTNFLAFGHNCYSNFRMNTSEKLCLNWNDFKQNQSYAFRDLRKDNDLLDVTLACEDGQIGAHKVVLASASPLFMNIFKSNKHSHPLVYMRGLKSNDLSAMLDFLYFGEANVYQDDLDSFLALAEELKLKGLTGSVENKGNDDQDTLVSGHVPKKLNKPNMEEAIYESDNPTKDLQEFISHLKTSIGTEVALNNHKKISVGLEQLDEQIDSMMELSGNKVIIGGSAFTAMICKVCGKEARKDHMKEHIEAYHITGVEHTCDICGQISRSRVGLRSHNFRKHN